MSTLIFGIIVLGRFQEASTALSKRSSNAYNGSEKDLKKLFHMPLPCTAEARAAVLPGNTGGIPGGREILSLAS
jgi:hypothetical protein